MFDAGEGQSQVDLCSVWDICPRRWFISQISSNGKERYTMAKFYTTEGVSHLLMQIVNNAQEKLILIVPLFENQRSAEAIYRRQGPSENRHPRCLP